MGDRYAAKCVWALTLKSRTLAGLGLTFVHDEWGPGDEERAKLTKEEDLCGLLPLFDEFLGFLQTFVDLPGFPGRLFLLPDALHAFVLRLFGGRHEGRGEGVIRQARVGDGLHGEEVGNLLEVGTREEKGCFNC